MYRTIGLTRFSTVITTLAVRFTLILYHRKGYRVDTTTKTIAIMTTPQTANEIFNAIHPINLTPSARVWKKLKTKHEGIVMVFQARGFRNGFGRVSDVSHDCYICYGGDAIILNQVMGCLIYSEASAQKVEIDNVEVLACFVKVTTEALEKAGYKVNWINPADLLKTA